MRIARKLALLATLALTALAFAAPTATAQTSPLEITNEATGEHCPNITVSGAGHTVTGGCVIHLVSENEFVLRQHIFGIESQVLICESEFTARLNEDAEGYATNQILPDHGACNREACDEETPPKEKRPWHMGGFEGATTPEPHPDFNEFIRLRFCVETPTNTSHPSGETNCEIDIPLREVESAGSHQYELGEAGVFPGAEMAGHGTAGFRCELIGHWLTENDGSYDQVEAAHIQP